MTRTTFPQRRTAATRLRQSTALAAVLGAAACGASDRKSAVGADSAASAPPAATPAAVGAATPAADTGMAGMNRSAPKDSNQAFLRMMSDHHEGLILLADSAKGRVQAADAKAKARELDDKQHREQREMLAMLRREYQDSITPMVMPSNRAMLDSVVRGPQGAEVDRVFYRQVIAHHREGIQMMDKMLPQLRGEVRSMAQRMRADQQREIQELERKAGQGA